MGRSDAATRRCWQEWVANGRFQRHDGSGRPRATADREDRLIFISAVIAPDSSSSAIRRVTRTRVSVHHDPLQMADRVKFSLVPTPTQPLTHACSLSSQITVVLGPTSRTVLLSFLLQYPLLIFQQDNARPTYGTCFYELSYSLSNTSLAIQIARSLSNRAVFDLMRMRLHLPGNVDDLARQLSKFGKKFRRRPSGALSLYTTSCGGLHPGLKWVNTLLSSLFSNYVTLK
ncbi:HTH_Tnp_Tc3_2 domain-containing protein [Trichonephila clavipes]|nr:HTH_Tnp_Tc3_2 domain-containing protein [Trichonephila clavipes]